MEKREICSESDSFSGRGGFRLACVFRTAIAAIAAAACLCASASPVDKSAAERAAKNFLSTSAVAARILPDREVSGVTPRGRLWIAQLSPSGHIIVAGSTKCHPIVSFSHENYEEPADDSPRKQLLDAEDENAAALEQDETATEHSGWNSQEASGEMFAKPKKALLKVASMPEGTVTYVGPLLGAGWGQNPSPYNDFTPKLGPCGCMATAGGMEMRYWRWPYRFGGSRQVDHSMEKFPVNYPRQTIRVNGEVPLDYDSMLPSYGAGSTRYQRYQTSALILWAQSYVKMAFVPGGAYGTKKLCEYANDFGYEKGPVMSQGRDGYANLWNAIKADLDYGSPVQVNTGGHQMVVDGYAIENEGMENEVDWVNINFGWGSQVSWENLHTALDVGYSHGVLADFQIGFRPRKMAQIDPLPPVNTTSVPLAWHIPPCHTNAMSGFDVKVYGRSDELIDFTDDFSESLGEASSTNTFRVVDGKLRGEAGSDGVYTYPDSYRITESSRLTFSLERCWVVLSSIFVEASFEGGDWETVGEEIKVQGGSQGTQDVEIDLANYAGRSMQLRLRLAHESSGYYYSGDTFIKIDDLTLSNVYRFGNVAKSASIQAADDGRTDYDYMVEGLADGELYSFTVTPVMEDGSDAVSTRVWTTTGTPAAAPSIEAISVPYDNIEILQDGFYAECGMGITNEIVVTCSESTTALAALPSHITLMPDEKVSVEKNGNEFTVRLDTTEIADDWAGNMLILTLAASNADGATAYTNMMLRIARPCRIDDGTYEVVASGVAEKPVNFCGADTVLDAKGNTLTFADGTFISRDNGTVTLCDTVGGGGFLINGLDDFSGTIKVDSDCLSVAGNIPRTAHIEISSGATVELAGAEVDPRVFTGEGELQIVSGENTLVNFDAGTLPVSLHGGVLIVDPGDETRLPVYGGTLRVQLTDAHVAFGHSTTLSHLADSATVEFVDADGNNVNAVQDGLTFTVPPAETTRIWTPNATTAAYSDTSCWRDGILPSDGEYAIFNIIQDATMNFNLPASVALEGLKITGGGRLTIAEATGSDNTLSAEKLVNDTALVVLTSRIVDSRLLPLADVTIEAATFEGCDVESHLAGTLKTADGETALTSEFWRGTVILTGRLANLFETDEPYYKYWFNPNSVGNANSIVRLNGTSGYFEANSPTFTTPVELVDNGDTPALDWNDGSSSSTATFKKLLGDGTFKTSGSGGFGEQIILNDISDFTGAFNLASKTVAIGNEVTTSTDGGLLDINNGYAARIAAGKTWRINDGVVLDGATAKLDVAGELVTPTITARADNAQLILSDGGVIEFGGIPSESARVNASLYAGTLRFTADATIADGACFSSTNSTWTTIDANGHELTFAAGAISGHGTIYPTSTAAERGSVTFEDLGYFAGTIIIDGTTDVRLPADISGSDATLDLRAGEMSFTAGSECRVKVGNGAKVTLTLTAEQMATGYNSSNVTMDGGTVEFRDAGGNLLATVTDGPAKVAIATISEEGEYRLADIFSPIADGGAYVVKAEATATLAVNDPTRVESITFDVVDGTTLTLATAGPQFIAAEMKVVGGGAFIVDARQCNVSSLSDGERLKIIGWERLDESHFEVLAPEESAGMLYMPDWADDGLYIAAITNRDWNTINVNFTAGDNGLTTQDSLGLVPVPGTMWNNMPGAEGSLSLVKVADSDLSGTQTRAGIGVAVSMTRGYWSCTNLVASSDLRYGYIDESTTEGQSTPTVTITGIPFDAYRVIVYHATDSASVQFGYDAVNGDDLTYSGGVLTSGTTTWGDSGGDHTALAIAEGVNTLVSGIYSNSMLTVVAHKDGDARGCIAAIQVVKVDAAEIDEEGECTLAGLFENVGTTSDLVVNVDESAMLDVGEATSLSAITFNIAEGKTLVLTGETLTASRSITVNGGGVLETSANALSGTITGGGTLRCRADINEEGGYSLAGLFGIVGASSNFAINVNENATLDFGGVGTLRSLAFNIAEGKELTLTGGELTVTGGVTLHGKGVLRTSATNALTGTIAGDGTFYFDMDNKTAKPALTGWTDAQWTGTLWVENGAKTGWLFNEFGNENSTLRLSNIECYISSTETLNPILKLEGEGLKITDGNQGTVETVKKLTGSGPISISWGSGSGNGLVIQDASVFTGSISLSSNPYRRYQVTFGESGVAGTTGKIIVSNDGAATIASGAVWSPVGGMEVSGTLAFAGTGTANCAVTASTGATLDFSAVSREDSQPPVNGTLALADGVSIILPEGAELPYRLAASGDGSYSGVTCRIGDGEPVTVKVALVGGVLKVVGEATISESGEYTLNGLYGAVVNSGAYSLNVEESASLAIAEETEVDAFIIDVSAGETLTLTGETLSAATLSVSGEGSVVVDARARGEGLSAFDAVKLLGGSNLANVGVTLPDATDELRFIRQYMGDGIYMKAIPLDFRSININFTYSGNVSTENAVGLIGIPGTMWDNMAGANGTLQAVHLFDGATSASTYPGLQVVVSGSRGSYACTSLFATNELRHGYIDENGSNPTPTVTISGIPFDAYRVIVYHATDTANAKFGYDTINGEDLTYASGVLASGTGSWGNAGGQNSALDIQEGVNTLVSGVYTNSTLTVVAHRGGSARGCIAAIQVVVDVKTVSIDGEGTYNTADIAARFGDVRDGTELVLDVNESATLLVDDAAPAKAIRVNIADDKTLTLGGSGRIVLGSDPCPRLAFVTEGENKWTGTLAMGWKVANQSNRTSWMLDNYGISGSTVEVVHDIEQGYFQKPGGDVPSVAPAVYFAGNVTINNGYTGPLTTFSGVGMAEGKTFRTRGSSTKYKFTTLENFKGTLEARNSDTVEIDTIVCDAMPALGELVARVTVVGTAVLNDEANVVIAVRGREGTIPALFVTNATDNVSGFIAKSQSFSVREITGAIVTVTADGEPVQGDNGDYAVIDGQNVVVTYAADGAYVVDNGTIEFVANDDAIANIGIIGGTTTATPAVARVGSTYYTTLKAAVDAAAVAAGGEPDETVVLLADCEEALTLAKGMCVTIDANGHTYIEPAAPEGAYTFDVVEDSEGVTTYTARDWYEWNLTLGECENATVAGLPTNVMENAENKTITFTVAADDLYRVTGVTVSSGELVAGENGEYTYEVSGDAVVTVATERYLVLVTVPPIDGTVVTVTADGETVEGENGVYTVGRGKSVVVTYAADGEYVVTGDAIEFTPDVDTDIGEDGWTLPVSTPAVARAGSTYYTTLQAAVDAAAVAADGEQGEMVVLLADSEENLTLAKGMSVTINANGHTYNASSAADGSYTFDAAEVSDGVTTYAARDWYDWTVIYANWDGEELQRSVVCESSPAMPEYAGEMPTKEATAQYSYSFAGWGDVAEVVTGDVTYTAQFEATTRSYTITWLDDDGTEIDVSEDVAYGTLPTHGDPARTLESPYRQDFAGWSPVIESVTSNATYRATFHEIVADVSTLAGEWEAKDGDVIVGATEQPVKIPGGARVSVNGVAIVGAGGGAGASEPPSFDDGGLALVTEFNQEGDSSWTITTFAELESDSQGSAVTDDMVKIYAAKSLEELKTAQPLSDGYEIEERKSAVKRKIRVEPRQDTGSWFFKIGFGTP